jgi:hypothetical protein
VQRLYSGSDDSEPVKVVSLTSGGTGTPYALEAGSQSVGVSVAIEGTLHISDELVMLRLTGGSRTSAVSCYDADSDGTPDADPGFNNFRTAIVEGCNVPYQLNAPPAVCPDDAPPPGPPTCVPTQTGEGAGPTLQGLDTRFASCPAHDWPTIDPATDPRVVKLLITDFSALGGSGTTEVPVTNVATFYVSGWTGSKCSNNGDPPFEVKKGAIWGYFVKYIAPDPQSDGTEACDPTALTPCLVALVK